VNFGFRIANCEFEQRSENFGLRIADLNKILQFLVPQSKILDWRFVVSNFEIRNPQSAIKKFSIADSS